MNQQIINALVAAFEMRESCIIDSVRFDAQDSGAYIITSSEGDTAIELDDYCDSEAAAMAALLWAGCESISETEYRNHPAKNFSRLKKMDQSPLHYLRDVQPGNRNALDVGSAIHCAILEPDLFESRFVSFDGKVRRGAAYDAFVAENAGRTVISSADMNAVRRAAQATLSDAAARELLDSAGALVEQPIFGASPWSRHELKCKPDLLIPGAVVELKSSKDASPHYFSKSVASFAYHAQATLYTELTEQRSHFFIVVEKAEPFDVAVYETSKAAIEEGARCCERWLKQLERCEDSGIWPGSTGGKRQSLQLPEWAFSSQPELKL